MRYTQDQRRLMRNGWMWAIYDGMTAAFLPAFALALGASSTIVGLITSLQFLAVMVGEIPGAWLAEKYRKKPAYLALTLVSRFGWLAVAAAPFLFQNNPLQVVLGGFTLLKLLESASDPAWTSLTADIVPAKTRGRFFGMRLRLLGFAGMVTALLAGHFLDLFQKGSLWGFTALFCVGIAFGLGASLSLRRVHEAEDCAHERHSLKDFLTVPSTLRPLLWCVMFFNFSVQIASPLMSIYLLRDINLSYTLYAAVGAASTLVKILSYPIAGRLSDRFGDKPVAFLSIMGAAFVPLSYVFVLPGREWVLALTSIITGVSWAGVDITLFNLLLGLTTQGRRAAETATYNLLTAIPMIISPIIGGMIDDGFRGGLLWFTAPQFIFLLSFMLRASSSVLLAFVQEPRKKEEHYPAEVVNWVVHMHPVRGLQRTAKFLICRVRRGEVWFSTRKNSR